VRFNGDSEIYTFEVVPESPETALEDQCDTEDEEEDPENDTENLPYDSAGPADDGDARYNDAPQENASDGASPPPTWRPSLRPTTWSSATAPTSTTASKAPTASTPYGVRRLGRNKATTRPTRATSCRSGTRSTSTPPSPSSTPPQG